MALAIAIKPQSARQQNIDRHLPSPFRDSAPILLLRPLLLSSE
jgi:hypothetical protein